jgi:hypothetical protein
LLLIAVQVRSFARVSTTAAACRDGDDERDIHVYIDRAYIDRRIDNMIASVDRMAGKVVLGMRA